MKRTGIIVVGVVVAALVAAGVLTVVASGGPITTGPAWFVPTSQQPEAGHVFTGLVLDFAGTQWSTTVCSWRIPKGSAGKRLRVSGAMAGETGGNGTSLGKIGAISWLVSR